MLCPDWRADPLSEVYPVLSGRHWSGKKDAVTWFEDGFSVRRLFSLGLRTCIRLQDDITFRRLSFFNGRTKIREGGCCVLAGPGLRTVLLSGGYSLLVFEVLDQDWRMLWPDWRPTLLSEAGLLHYPLSFGGQCSGMEDAGLWLEYGTAVSEAILS
jgi:hypothetical protein